MGKIVKNVYILGIIFAIVAGLNAYAGLLQVNGPVQREFEMKLEAELDFVVGEISAAFTLAAQTLRTAANYAAMESAEEKINSLFAELQRQSASYLSVYRGLPGEDDSALWYDSALKAGDIVFTSSRSDRSVITASAPVFGSGEDIVAVAAIDLSIEDLLASLEAEDDVLKRKIFIFTPYASLLGDPKEADFGPGFFPEPAGITSYQLEGVPGYLRWETVGESELLVAAFASSSDPSLRLQNRWILGVMFLSLIVGALVVFVFLRIHIVIPMRELGHDLMAISLDDDVTYRLPVRKNNSLGVFRETLNVSLQKAQEHYEYVNRQKEELADAYNQLMAHEQQLQRQYYQIKENEEKIRFLAERDSLTGLLNRRKFHDDLEETLDSGVSGAVFLLDIDDFKNINDTQGHHFGDRILRSVAQLLLEEVPSGATVYRFGGDEFVIIVRQQPDLERIPVYRDKVNSRLQALLGEKKSTNITCSMGVVRFPLDGTLVEELLSKADIALHHAKQTGKNCYSVFEASMATMFSKRVYMENILSEAVRSEGFFLVYQPIIELKTGKAACFEAFVRLKEHDALPGEFIPIAEESDLILPLGYWVIKEVMERLARWQQEGKRAKPISVNLSTKQFHDPNLIDYLQEQLDATGIDPSLFEVEFREDVLFGNEEKALEIMERIKALGISLSLDDYGSGYSFINYMTKMPVDYLKIHRAITENTQDNGAVMAGLVAIAHGLGIKVVAEQVETLEEAQMLREAKCDYLQGYLLSKPVRHEEAEQMLELNYAEILNLG